MAVAFESVATVGGGYFNDGALNYAIGKPSGLAEGDLMVASIGWRMEEGVSENSTFSPPAGWTQIASEINPEAHIKVWYKVADASDVAASDFTFTRPGGAQDGVAAGAIYRFSGASTPTAASAGSSGGSPSYTNTVTPVIADSILLFLVSSKGNDTHSTSGYAIATDNPTWTERHDIALDGSSGFGAGNVEGGFAGATGPRTAITATGNSSCAISGGTPEESVGVMVIVPPITNVTVSPSVINAPTAVQAPSVAAGAVVSPSVVSSPTAVQAPTVSTPEADWHNLDKGADPGWANVPKT